jgi:hypothetical protein
MASHEKQWRRLQSQCGELASFAALADDKLARVNDRVSLWSTGTQLEHIGIVNNRVMDNAIPGALKDLPENRAGKVLFIGRVMLFTGFIPRGKRKAPEVAVPQNAPLEKVRAGIARYEKCLADLEKQLDAIAASPGKFPHPILGPLSAGQWLRFLEVHTHHHIKIIRDIQRS